MQTIPVKNKANKTLDLFKAISCIIVTTAHLPPLFQDPVKNAYFNEWFLRFCVPFFFICSGYFFAKARNKAKNLQRIGWLFALANVLYLPAILEGAVDVSDGLAKIRWYLIFGYEHLWYLSAAAEGMVIWYLLEKIPYVNKLFQKLAVPGCFLLFLVGALLDEYFMLWDSGIIRLAGNYLALFGGPRNVIFMGFPLLVFGGAIARNEEKIRRIPVWTMLLAWVVLRALSYWECTFLFERRGLNITNDITFFCWWPALVLFALSLKFQIPIPDSISVLMRKMTEYVYILHPMAAVWISRYIHLEPVPLWIWTMILCSVVYYLLEKQFVIKK